MYNCISKFLKCQFSPKFTTDSSRVIYGKLFGMQETKDIIKRAIIYCELCVSWNKAEKICQVKHPFNIGSSVFVI